jgi:hypothetical protein
MLQMAAQRVAQGFFYSKLLFLSFLALIGWFENNIFKSLKLVCAFSFSPSFM